MIGITFCNSPAAMAPWGGYEKLIGTNPFAVSVPSASRGSILFDMATSKVAKSKINKARLSEKEIPDDWALDVNGNPTTDPLEAIKGVVLPMAEHKGYGLALSIDLIAGMLSGDAYIDKIHQCKPLEGQKIYYPGERKQLNMKKAENHGIDYDDATVAMLNTLKKSVGE